MLSSLFKDEIINWNTNLNKSNDTRESVKNEINIAAKIPEIPEHKNETTQIEIFRKYENNEILECF